MHPPMVVATKHDGRRCGGKQRISLSAGDRGRSSRHRIQHGCCWVVVRSIILVSQFLWVLRWLTHRRDRWTPAQPHSARGGFGAQLRVGRLRGRHGPARRFAGTPDDDATMASGSAFQLFSRPMDSQAVRADRDPLGTHHTGVAIIAAWSTCEMGSDRSDRPGRRAATGSGH
jgi:hypothetical protein